MSAANLVLSQYTGHILEVSSSVSGIKEANYALALSEPDDHDEVELLMISPKDGAPRAKTMDLPSGILPFDAVIRLKEKRSLHKDDLLNSGLMIDPELLESILRAIIMDQTRMYYRAVHKPRQTQPFIPGKSRINYAGRIYDEHEMENLVDAALEFYLTANRYDRSFCERLSAFLQNKGMEKHYVLTVNSGSSANLIAVSSLISQKLGDMALRENDEIICMAAGFPTSIAPIVQNSLTPVFVDIQLETNNIDTTMLEQALSPRTKAIFIAHNLGIPFDMDSILTLAEKHKLWVLEDNCDALGASYTLSREYHLIKDRNISGTRLTGTIGHFGTSSFYPAHQITMGEGGAVYSYDLDLYRIALSLRDWGRDCICDPGRDNTCKMRFLWKLGKLPHGYDHKYTYSHLGYNMKITDMQAAIGLAQMDKLGYFAQSRFENWKKLGKGLLDLEEFFYLPAYPKNAVPSPFGFMLTVKKDKGFTRDEITSYLEENNIQTRTLFAGNMLRQPAFTENRIKLRINGSPDLYSDELGEQEFALLPNTEKVMADGFWVGVYPGLTDEMIDYIVSKIHGFVTKYAGS